MSAPGGRGAEPAPHAPRIGRLARLLGPLRVDGVFWYRIHRFGATHVPDWFAPIGIAAFTAAFSVALSGIGRAIASNLEPVLGPAGWWTRRRRAFRTFREFAWCLTERYERTGPARPGRVARESRVEVDDIDVWLDASAAGGLIALSAHFGNWEFGSAIPATRDARRVHVVREPESDPRAQEFIRSLVESSSGGLHVTHFASDDPALGVRLLEALRAGEIVALQGDRPRRGGATAETTLFGRPYALPVGPFALARLADVPIVPVFLAREGRRAYRLRFGAAIRVAPDGDRRAAIRAAAALYATELERAIRAAPHQWFCFANLWP